MRDKRINKTQAQLSVDAKLIRLACKKHGVPHNLVTGRSKLAARLQAVLLNLGKLEANKLARIEREKKHASIPSVPTNWGICHEKARKSKRDNLKSAIFQALLEIKPAKSSHEFLRQEAISLVSQGKVEKASRILTLLQ